MKKRNKLLVAFLSLFMLSCAFENSFAQSFNWNKSTLEIPTEVPASTQVTTNIVTDAQGYIIVTYRFTGDMQVDGVTFISNSGNSLAAGTVIAKYFPGGQLIFSHKLHTTLINGTAERNHFTIDDITVDANRDIYISGTLSDPRLYLGKGTNGQDYILNKPVTPNACYVAKIRGDGKVVWGRSWGANSAKSIVAGNGSIYVLGDYRREFSISNILVTHANVINDWGYNKWLKESGWKDIYIAKLNTFDGTPSWVRNSIASAEVNPIDIDKHDEYMEATDMEIDPNNGALYVSATFSGYWMTKPNDILHSWGPNSDIYYAKYDAGNGNTLWARTAGGWDEDYAGPIAVDESYLYLGMGYASNYLLASSWIVYNTGGTQSAIGRFSKADLFPNILKNIDGYLTALTASGGTVYLGAQTDDNNLQLKYLTQNFSPITTISDIGNGSSRIYGISKDPRVNTIVNFCGSFRTSDLIMGPAPNGVVEVDNFANTSGFLAQVEGIVVPDRTGGLDVTIDLNPTTASNIPFTLIATSAERVDVTLVNELTGAIEYQNYFNVVEGENRFSISLNRLEKGTYSLVAQSPSGSTSKHVVIE